MPLTIFKIGATLSTWIHPNKSIQLTFNDKSPTPTPKVSLTILNPQVKLTQITFKDNNLEKSKLNSISNSASLLDITKKFELSDKNRPKGNLTIQFTNIQTSEIFHIYLELSLFQKPSTKSKTDTSSSKTTTSSSTSRLSQFIYERTCHAYVYSAVTHDLKKGSLDRLFNYMENGVYYTIYPEKATPEIGRHTKNEKKRTIDCIESGFTQKKTKMNISMVNDDRNNNNRRERNTQESDNTLKGEKLDNSVPQFENVENLLNDPIIYQYLSSLKFDNQSEFNMTSQTDDVFLDESELFREDNLSESDSNELLREDNYFQDQQLDETYKVDKVEEGQVNHDELIIDDFVKFADSYYNNDDPFNTITSQYY